MGAHPPGSSLPVLRTVSRPDRGFLGGGPSTTASGFVGSQARGLLGQPEQGLVSPTESDPTENASPQNRAQPETADDHGRL